MNLTITRSNMFAANICYIFLFAFFSTSELTNCQSVLDGFKDYTGATLGNINILISAPHGGLLKPSDIESRSETTAGDYNTLKLATELRDQLAIIFKAEDAESYLPFLVYNKLHRVKMDPNRDSARSCANEFDDCGQAYTDFHGFIEKDFHDDFMHSGSQVFEQGLIIDIHGTSHKGFIELGYTLSANDLDTNQLPMEKSSIRKLFSLSEYDMENLIRGPQSLGSILQEFYNTVPSSKNKSPNGAKYFPGGYITKTYPKIGLNVIQMELPYVLRKNSNYRETGKSLAQAIHQFYQSNNFGNVVENN